MKIILQIPYGIKIKKCKKDVYAFAFIFSLGCFEICELRIAIWYKMSEKAPLQVIKTEIKKKMYGQYP